MAERKKWPESRSENRRQEPSSNIWGSSTKVFRSANALKTSKPRAIRTSPPNTPESRCESKTELPSDAKSAAEYLALRDRLYPHGLKIVQWSYTDEAGEAKLAEERLSDDDKILLKNIPVPNGTLFDEHQARINAAKELGELEKKKTSLAAATETQGTTPSDAVRARNHWIRVVTAFVKVLELEDLSDADEARILNQLHDAERRADQRTSKTEGKAARHTETAKPSNTSTEPTGSATG